MIASKKLTFYDDVVRITHEYLGPAADRFCARQIRNHLSKEPEKLRKNELAGLLDWFSMAMAVLSEDEAVVHRYTDDLRDLIGTKVRE